MELIEIISTYVLSLRPGGLFALVALVLGTVLLGIYCSSDVTGER